jgi:hypothetical protein
MALAPEGLSARAIHAGLVAGAVDGIAPADVPPAADRRAMGARASPRRTRSGRRRRGEDTMTVVAARLRKQLKRRAGEGTHSSGDPRCS